MGEESCLRVGNDGGVGGGIHTKWANCDMERLEGLGGEFGLQVHRLCGVHGQRASPPGGGARLQRRDGHIVALLHVIRQLSQSLWEVPPGHLLR